MSAAQDHDGAPLLGAGSTFRGVITFRGRARVDGHFEGEVDASGRLEVGPEGCVIARVAVDELVVAGRVEGDVVARERIELLPGAEVRGSLQTPRLVMADGAWIEGPIATGGTPLEVAPLEAPAAASA